MTCKRNTQMIPGLATRYTAEIKAIIARYPTIEQVILYGSRAKGTHTDRSDIDLALIGNENGVGHHTLSGIKLDLGESEIPVSVDVLDYAALENQDLKGHIDRVGQTIYFKEQEGG